MDSESPPVLVIYIQFNLQMSATSVSTFNWLMFAFFFPSLAPLYFEVSYYKIQTETFVLPFFSVPALKLMEVNRILASCALTQFPLLAWLKLINSVFPKSSGRCAISPGMLQVHHLLTLNPFVSICKFRQKAVPTEELGMGGDTQWNVTLILTMSLWWAFSDCNWCASSSFIYVFKLLSISNSSFLSQG